MFQAKLHWHVEDLGIRHACSKLVRLSSMGKSNDHTDQTVRNSINFSAIKLTSTAKENWENGSALKTSTGQMAITTQKRLTKHSEKMYRSRASCIASCLACHLSIHRAVMQDVILWRDERTVSKFAAFASSAHCKSLDSGVISFDSSIVFEPVQQILHPPFPQ